MKKTVIGIAIILTLLIAPGVTYAADALYRMLHGDVEAFKQDQDAFIVGQLMDKQGDRYTVKVLKVLSGKVIADTILVSDDFTYGWDKAAPKVNDFCIFSLKRTGDYYKKAWGIFKTTSGDYNTLKLESLNAPTEGLRGDLACIQWYVNSDGKENDFYGHYTTWYVRRPNGQDVQIYPVPTAGTQAVFYKDAINPIQDYPEKNSNYSYFPFIAVAAFIGIGTAVLLKVRNGRFNDKRIK